MNRNSKCSDVDENKRTYVQALFLIPSMVAASPGSCSSTTPLEQYCYSYEYCLPETPTQRPPKSGVGLHYHWGEGCSSLLTDTYHIGTIDSHYIINVE